MSNKAKWGWFSYTIAVRHGYTIYKNERGENVYTTSLTHEPINPYPTLEDVYLVGEVVDYIYCNDGTIKRRVVTYLICKFSPPSRLDFIHDKLV